MKTINQKLPIAFWEDLACFVQDNEIEKIGDFLRENNIKNNLGKEYPTHVQEIGTLSLIKAINEAKSNGYKENPKDILFENIYSMKNLGIKHIAFNPIEFYKISGIGNNALRFTKVYTDGKFRIEKIDIAPYRETYKMEEIQDANYILNISIDTEPILQTSSTDIIDNPNYTKIVSSSICIKNFKFLSSLPSKNELSLVKLPELSIANPTLYDWKGRPYYREVYEKTNTKETGLEQLKNKYQYDNCCYSKELIKSITTK